MIRKNVFIAAAATALLLLMAGCGSTSDILGGGNNNYERTIHGTVDAVDLNSNSVVLMNTSGYNTSLSTGGSGNTVRVYFDNNTTVSYNGQTYRPENLDRGDQVDVRVRESGNQLMAESMTVTYNTNPNGTQSAGGVYGSNTTSYSGTVRYVDTTRRTIELDRGYGSNVIVDFDPNTTVLYNGRSYLPADLEVGDQVTIYTRDIGGGHMVAQNIDVTRSMTSSSGGTSSSNYATLRGTVRSIDTYNHTLQLEQTSYISGFLPNGSSSRSSVITVQYDPNATIYVNGQQQSLTGIERGDVIEIQARDLGNNTWRASSFTLVRDIRR